MTRIKQAGSPVLIVALIAGLIGYITTRMNNARQLLQARPIVTVLRKQ